MAGKKGEVEGGTVHQDGFLFAEVDHVARTGAGVWTDSAIPRRLEAIRKRWIYAFEIPENDGDRKPILVAEYYADEHGSLTHVPGSKRRRIDLEGRGIEPTPVSTASLPQMIQGQPVNYFFAAMRVRLSKTAIAAIENHRRGEYNFFTRRVLSKGGDFVYSADRPEPFIRVTDPLTTAEWLHQRYVEALNEALRFSCPMKGDAADEEAERQTRRYQLGKILRDTYLMDKGHLTDPLELRGHLMNEGEQMLDFLKSHERKLEQLATNTIKTAEALVSFLESDLWRQCQSWYRSNLDGYHVFLESYFRCLERLHEVRPGVEHLRRLVESEDPQSPHNELLAPEPDASKEIKEAYEKAFPVFRKTLTAVFLGVAELGAAMAVNRQADSAAKRIVRTLSAHLKHTDIKLVTTSPTGRVARALKVRVTTVQIQISYEQAKVELEHWIERGKSNWPKDTHWAHASEVLGKLMCGIEVVNFYNVLHEIAFKAERETDDYIEGIGAILDLLIAFEDLIREHLGEESEIGGAESLGAERAGQLARVAKAGAGSEVGEMVEAGAAAERKGLLSAAKKFGGRLLTKAVGPVAFKMMGAISALIDTYINSKKAYRAYRRGEQGQALGYGVVAAGALMVAAGSIVSAIGYGTTAAAIAAGDTAAIASATYLTAMSCAFFVFGVAVFVIGVLIVNAFTLSCYQTFAKYCVFGTDPKHTGTADWLEGNFAEWTDTPEGLDRQIRVLMDITCAFEVKGSHWRNEAVVISLRAVPPHAELQVEFTIEYDTGHTLHPSCRVDPSRYLATTLRPSDGVATAARGADPGKQVVQVDIERPTFLRNAKAKASRCSVRLACGGEPRMLLPLHGPVRYEIQREGHQVNSESTSSLEIPEDGGSHRESHGPMQREG